MVDVVPVDAVMVVVVVVMADVGAHAAVTIAEFSGRYGGHDGPIGPRIDEHEVVAKAVSDVAGV